MHESLPPRRRIFTTAHDEEEEYDVYDFFPSQNRFYMVCALMCFLSSPRSSITTHYEASSPVF